jgi:hypothetical protein
LAKIKSVAEFFETLSLGYKATIPNTYIDVRGQELADQGYTMTEEVSLNSDVQDQPTSPELITNIASTAGASKINSLQNGLLMRSDLHATFDNYRFSINPDVSIFEKDALNDPY